MKLIAIKCPNCSAKLNVEENKEFTTCSYCGSQIYIDDENMKLKNRTNKKILNYLELANRFFDDNEYEEAYIKFDQVLVLDPNNYEAIFKRGICISLNSNYLNFNTESAYNGFKNAINIIRGINNNEDANKIINNYALILLDVILKLKEFIVDFYDKHLFTKKELMIYIKHLYSCLYVLETTYTFTYELNNKVKSKYNKNIYNLIKYLKNKKKYSDFYDVSTGNSIIEKYDLSKNECKKLNKKLKYYENDMLLINEKFKIKHESLKKQRVIVTLVELLLIFMLILMFIRYKNILYNILLLLDIILFSFDIFENDLIKSNKFLLIVKILIALISIVGYFVS